MTDPRGRWFRVYARQIRSHPKFHELSGAELGAWLTLRSECELRDSAVLADRSEAVLILRRRHLGPKVLDRLIALKLFDQQKDGSIAVHDRDDHDRPRYPSDAPEAVRERVQRHRNEPVTTGNESVTSGNESRAREKQPTASEAALRSSPQLTDEERAFLTKAQRDADVLQPAKSKWESIGEIAARTIGNGEPEQEADAYVFAVRILGYAPNSEDFRSDLVALEEKFGKDKVLEAEQRSYQAALEDGRRLRPFDLIKDARTLLLTGKHVRQKELTAEQKAKAEKDRKASEAKVLDEIKRQQDDEFKRHHPDWKPA